MNTEHLAKIQELAKKGDPEAQHKLGLMFKNRDDELAFDWFNKAAAQGHSTAQYDLAVMYELGWGVPKSYEQSVYWYRKAAALGDIESQIQLLYIDEKETGMVL